MNNSDLDLELFRRLLQLEKNRLQREAWKALKPVFIIIVVAAFIYLFTRCSTASPQDMPIAVKFDSVAVQQPLEQKQPPKTEPEPTQKPASLPAIQWVLTLRTYFATMCNEYVEEGPTVNQKCVEAAMECASKVNLEAVGNIDALVGCGKIKGAE